MQLIKLPLTALLIILAFGAKAQNCTIVASDIVCKEEIMSFDVTSSASIQSVLWDMGDATTSSQKSFNHKYSSSGTKTVKVILSLTGGGTCTASKQITVYEIPQFKNRLKPDNIYCLSQNKVCLIDSSYGGDAGINIKKRIILWDDGDQTTTLNPAIGGIVCHTYTNAGTFKITIELTNDKDCKAKKEIDIKILTDVVPVFTVAGGKGCDSANLVMEDITKKDTGEIVSRIYDWGDGNKTTTKGRLVNHFYQSSGFYKISLTLVQKNGCRTNKDTIIEIFIPEIKFNITKDAYKKCVGHMFRLEQNDALLGAYYQWTFAGGQRDGKVLEIAPGLGKNYFQLDITYAGCKKTLRYDSVEVVGIIPSIRVFNGNQCTNKDTVYFCETDYRYGTKNVTFFWNFADDKAPQCTTSRRNNSNVNSNCNFATDSIGKHFYKSGVCKTWRLFINDLDNGCDREEKGVINVIKPDTFGFQYSANRLCLGLKPDYKISFDHTLCSVIDIKINLDSACDRKNFIPYGSKALYQKTCNPNGWVTVGFAIKYGDRKVYKNGCDGNNFSIDSTRECYDTIWYHNWYRLLEEPFPPFEVSGKCIPAEVVPVLLDSNQKNISFSIWDWGDNTKSDTLVSAKGASVIPRPKHIYKEAGAYTVNFYIENENRCYGTYNQKLILGFNMHMKFDTIICPGIKVKFKDSIFYQYSSVGYWHNLARKQQGKESFKWDFDDGRGFVTDTANPVITFPAKGIYKIRLAAKDSSDCLDTLTKKINVGGVYAGIKNITKKIICNDILQFFDSSFSDFGPPADSLVKFYWEFGDKRNPSYLKDPFHYYKNFGQFTIIHKIENTRGCKDSATINLKIEGPEPNFDIVSDTVACVPFTAEFKNTSTKTKDYIWYFGDPLKSKLSTNKDTNVKFTYSKPGIYYIYLFGSDSVVNPNTGNSIYYCSATFPDSTSLKPAIRRIVVLPIPRVDFFVDSLLCKGKPFAVTDNSDPIYKRYKWVLEKTDSIETTNKTGVLNPKDTGMFSIKYTPFYNPQGPYQRYCYDTIRKKVKITEVLASIDFIKDDFCPIYTFTNSSKGYKSIKWDLGHSASGDENNIKYENVVTHSYVPDTGTFYPCLFVESEYGCRDTVCKEFKIKFTIKAVVPNVFTPDNGDDLNDAFDIVMENAEEYNLYIYNRWGQLVYHSDRDGSRNDGINWTGKTQMTSANCPDGTYFYIFKYKFKCEDKKREAHGIVTLIRDKK